MEDCQQAFKNIKDYMSNTLLLVSPERDMPLFLYICNTMYLKTSLNEDF